MALVNFADKYTATDKKTERYSDFYTNLNKNIGTKDLARLTDENSIIRSIKNIVLTRRGERPFFPEFGCNITGLLFENFNEFTKSAMETEIKTAIENFEPRASVVDVVVQENVDFNEVYATIYFSTINSTETTSVSFLLNRIR